MTELEYKIIEGFKIKLSVNWGLIIILIMLAGFWIEISAILTNV